MKKSPSLWKKLSGWFRAFLILAAVYLAVGLGALGSFASTGGAYALNPQGANDSKQPSIVFSVSNPTEGDKTVKLSVVRVFVNIAAIYAEEGTPAQLRLGWGYGTDSSFSSNDVGYIENFFSTPPEEGKDEIAAVPNAIGNWVEPFELPEDGNKIDSYRAYRLRTESCGVLINEIVFVGEELDTDGVGTGKYRVVPATIDASHTDLPYDAEGGETKDDALKAAGALLDAQQLPATAQSSFFRFGQEEAYTYMTVREMSMGGSYDVQNIGKYNGDRVYGGLGPDLVALGGAIFGASPFGLRFFPMLASFGTLVFGALLCRRLFKSDKACLVFTLLYTLSSAAFGIGRLATPLSVGIFFFTAALFCVHRFYALGMKKAKLLSAWPLALGGLFTACSILVNGAYVIPAAGIAALFALGMVRQAKAKRYHLDLAIAEAEAEETDAPAEETEGEPHGKAKVAAVLSEYRFRDTVAPVVFLLSLLLGVFVLSVLATLPASFALVRLYDDPSNPALGVFGLGWKTFASGFTGGNAVANSGWAYLYETFRGAGTLFAVSGVAMNALAALIALAGVGYAIYRIVRIAMAGLGEREQRAELRRILVPLAGLVLCLVTASFAQGALAFVFLAYVFGFALAAGGAERLLTVCAERGGKYRKVALGVGISLLVLLALLFLVSVPYVFSIPLPAAVFGA